MFTKLNECEAILIMSEWRPEVWEESYSQVLGTSTSAVLTFSVAPTGSVSSSKTKRPE